MLSINSQWILCPLCGNKTRNKIREDTVLKNYPLYCPKCRQETVSRCIEYELLHKAISKLPETQRRRLLLYFFGELSYEQIAKLEGCTKMAVKGSVDIALKKLKKLFEKF